MIFGTKDQCNVGRLTTNYTTFGSKNSAFEKKILPQTYPSLTDLGLVSACSPNSNEVATIQQDVRAENDLQGHLTNSHSTSSELKCRKTFKVTEKHCASSSRSEDEDKGLQIKPDFQDNYISSTAQLMVAMDVCSSNQTHLKPIVCSKGLSVGTKADSSDSASSVCSTQAKRYQDPDILGFENIMSDPSEDSSRDELESSKGLYMFKLDNSCELADYSEQLSQAGESCNLDFLDEGVSSYQNICSSRHFKPKSVSSSKEVSDCREEVQSYAAMDELDQILGQGKTFSVGTAKVCHQNSNLDQHSVVNANIDCNPEAITPDCCMNLYEEFNGILFDVHDEKVKKFSDLNKCKNTRAWEVIQKNSNKLHTSMGDDLLDCIIKAKKNQNCGGDRAKKSKVYSVNRVCNMERDTIPSSQYSQASHTVADNISKIYPHKVGQKILRIFRKYYKTLFELYLKRHKIVFNRAAKNMKKETFEDLLINFMDELFADHLENLDDDTIEKLMASLSVLILKDRSKKKEEISQGLDFTEWSDLADNPNAKKSVIYFSKKENAFLYTFFFLLECKQLVEKTSESCCCKSSTQTDEALVLFYQMHEFYNESILFTPKDCQGMINNAVNVYLKSIVL